MDSHYTMFSRIMRINHLCFARSFKHLNALGIYPGQVPILKMLHHKDGQPQKDLVRKGMVKASTVTVTLQRMEKAGLIMRGPDPENRQRNLIYLTQQGHDAVKAADNIIKELNDTMTASLTEAERLLMQRLLQQMVDALSAGEDEGPEDCEGGTPT